MKFIVDAPLGGLAKWLRFCGFDAGYRSLSAGREKLPSPAADTYILTGQQALAGLNRADILVISALSPLGQLKEVLRRLKISRRQMAPLNRCVRCNEPLTPVPRDRVQGLVPEHVFLHQRQFYQCPRCQRIFWPGSHLPPITAILDRALHPSRKAE